MTDLGQWVGVNRTRAKASESVCTLAFSLLDPCHHEVTKPQIAGLEDEGPGRSDPNCRKPGHPKPAGSQATQLTT